MLFLAVMFVTEYWLAQVTETLVGHCMYVCYYDYDVDMHTWRKRAQASSVRLKWACIIACQLRLIDGQLPEDLRNLIQDRLEAEAQ